MPIRGEDTGVEGEVPIFYRRHFTHVTPRDFDLSPYFQVKHLIKGRDDLYDPRNWMPMGDTDPREDLDKFITEVARDTYKNNPPPLPHFNMPKIVLLPLKITLV